MSVLLPGINSGHASIPSDSGRCPFASHLALFAKVISSIFDDISRRYYIIEILGVARYLRVMADTKVFLRHHHPLHGYLRRCLPARRRARLHLACLSVFVDLVA